MKKISLYDNPLLDKLQNTLKQEYHFKEVVGQGGTSYVVKVYNLALNRFEALKIVSAENILEKNIVQRFYQEAQSLVQLKKTNRTLHIPEIFSFKQIDKFLFYTMEFIDGKSLDEIIDNSDLDITTSLNITRQLAQTLSVIHKEGIIHRDIKPANIILDRKMNPWIVDFGMLKKVNSSNKITDRGARLGTPIYMSPEQAMGNDNITKSTDLYSLGAVLYEMATFQKYIKEKSLMGIFHSIVYDDHGIPSDVQPDLPQIVDDACEKALSKNPKKRYQCAEEMLHEIEKYLQKPQ